MADVTTKRNAVFIEVSLKEHTVIGSKDELFKACRTTGRFHAAAFLVLGG